MKKEPTEFPDSLKSHIPPDLQKLLNKANTLNPDEMTHLIEGIAKAAIDFYKLKQGKYVAIGFNGCILESADSKIELLMKIQGRDFKQDIFVWHVGSDSFMGWETVINGEIEESKYV